MSSGLESWVKDGANRCRRRGFSQGKIHRYESCFALTNWNILRLDLLPETLPFTSSNSVQEFLSSIRGLTLHGLVQAVEALESQLRVQGKLRQLIVDPGIVEQKVSCPIWVRLYLNLLAVESLHLSCSQVFSTRGQFAGLAISAFSAVWVKVVGIEGRKSFFSGKPSLRSRWQSLAMYLQVGELLLLWGGDLQVGLLLGDERSHHVDGCRGRSCTKVFCFRCQQERVEFLNVPFQVRRKIVVERLNLVRRKS